MWAALSTQSVCRSLSLFQRSSCAQIAKGGFASTAFRVQTVRHHRKPFLDCLVQQRSSATTPEKLLAEQIVLPPLLDSTLRGFGQVVFCNSAVSGALIGAGLLYGNPALAALASVGCLSATLTARVASMEASSVSTGLMGYNGALVGCGFSVFLGAPLEPTIVATAAGGAASAFVTAWLGRYLTSVPQWTLAFNIVALAVLAYVRPLETSEPPPPSNSAELAPSEVGPALLSGVSQIFVVNSPLAGALVTAGIAAYSPQAAASALCGSLLGVGTGLAWGANPDEIRDGLWGYNPALTALAISVFFVPVGYSPAALAMGGAVASALTAVAFKGFFASAFQAPALTVPFCAVASACYLLGGRAPGLRLAARPHSPEENLRAFRAA